MAATEPATTEATNATCNKDDTALQAQSEKKHPRSDTEDKEESAASKKRKLNSDQQEAYEELIPMLREANVKDSKIEDTAHALAGEDIEVDLLAAMDDEAIRGLKSDELSQGVLERIVQYNKRKREQ